MKKVGFIVFAFLLLYGTTLCGDTIWTEDFNSVEDQGVGAVGPTPTITSPSSGKWSVNVDNCDLSADTDWFRVENDLFEARDVDGTQLSGGSGDGALWTSEAINISGYTNISISVDVSCSGTFEDQDFIKASYQIDSGTITQFGFLNDDFVAQTFSVDGLSGSSLVIYMEADNNAGTEYTRFDNVTVIGTPLGGVADPTDFTAVSVSSSQIDLSWTENANSDPVLIAWNSSDTFGTPVDGTSYASGTTIPGGGTSLGTDNDGAFNHTSLISCTQYFYKIWSVDGSVNYSSGVTANAITCKEEPSNYVTNFTATTDGSAKIDLSWTENDGPVVADGYLIKASTSDNVSNPTDGAPVVDNTTIGDDSGAMNISHGTTSYEWSGLTPESTYYFKIFSYTNSGSTINYKTDGTPPNASTTTEGQSIQEKYVFFSEYIEGTSNNKAIEIYNGTNVSIDLSEYQVKLASGGGGWGTTQDLSGTLSSGDVFVIYNSGASSSITDVGNLSSSVTYFNGDDALGLFYNGALIDVIGEPDNDPGTAWSVAGTSNATVEHTLVRKSTVISGTTDWSASAGTDIDNSEWIIYPQDTFSYLGSHSGQTLPIVLSTFTAQYLNNKPTLYWSTQSETDNMGWFIYRNTTEDFTSSEKISDMIDGHGTTTEPQFYVYEDAEQLQVEQTYYYWLESVDYSGTIHHYDMVVNITVPDGDDPNQNAQVPTLYDISANPNPFSKSTSITFALSQTGRIDVTIYNIKGEIVKSFDTISADAEKEVRFDWNGKDDTGKALSNGVYLYSVKVNGKDYAAKQLILMK